MEMTCTYRLSATLRAQRLQLLRAADLDDEPQPDYTVCLHDGETMAAVGSRKGNILKCIAVDARYRGEDLTSTLLTELRREAFAQDISHLFLYTKPQNRMQFLSLFFYPVAETPDVLLLENKKGGLAAFIDSLPAVCREGRIGAAVMNCNPFTLGHRFLIETASRSCDHVYIFVLSEEQPPFPAADRLRLVREGTRDLPNVTVLPTGPYLLSNATFPAYFLKDKSAVADIQCRLDAQLFSEHYAPHFGIHVRYVGSEPLSPLTAQYNEALKTYLPPCGIEVQEIERQCVDGAPISATTVRDLLGQHAPEALRRLVPQSTFAYLSDKELI